MGADKFITGTAMLAVIDTPVAPRCRQRRGRDDRRKRPRRTRKRTARALIRGVGSLVFAVAITGVCHDPGLGIPETRAQCQSVNDVGDCVPDSHEQPNGEDRCVRINVLGACEDQYQLDHPPHTMVK